MAAQDSRNGSRIYWLIGVLTLLVVAAGLWLARGPESGSDPAGNTLPSAASAPMARPVPADSAQLAAAGTAGVRAPSQRISDRGRLSVALEDLREGDVLAVGLEMPDESRGEGPRQVRVVDVGGRLLETTAAPVDGAGTGLRLEIDPDWLQPGRYLIEVETAEKRPLALRRYVLQVQ